MPAVFICEFFLINAAGYISTVSTYEEAIRAYIRNQEALLEVDDLGLSQK
jgi:hypothetical protein